MVIRKYSNRRLYSLDESKYIIYADIVAAVQQKKDITIVEHPSGKDITRVTLLQVFAAVDAEAEVPQLTEQSLRAFLERAPARSGSTAPSARQEAGVRGPESRQP